MVKRIVLTATLIAFAMFAVKDGRMLHIAGLTGSCTIVQTAANGEQMEACTLREARGRARPEPQRLHRHRALRRPRLLALPGAGCLGPVNKSGEKQSQ